jgi:competence protein ComFB
MAFENVMETLVLQKLDEVIDSLGCCKCEKCRADIASYALNRLAPKYADTAQGKVFQRLGLTSTQSEVDILAAICDGAKLVRDHPHHED